MRIRFNRAVALAGTVIAFYLLIYLFLSLFGEYYDPRKRDNLDMIQALPSLMPPFGLRNGSG